MNTPLPALDTINAPTPSAPIRKLAYLLSIYPAVSHTFFLNEICELRKLGFLIDAASINSPDAALDGLTERETEERTNTFYIKALKPTNVLTLLAKTMLARPRVMLRGLTMALRLAPWNLPATRYALFYFAEAVLLGDWMRRRGHNHLHVHFGGSVSTVALIASVAWNFPFSLMLHGPEEFYDVNQFYLRQKVKHARFVLCISDHCRSQVMKVCDSADWQKLHVTRLGVDPKVFSPTDKTIDSIIEILSVGRLVPSKGQVILLRAFAVLVSRGHNLRLRLVGDGPDRPRIEAFIAEQGLNSSVILEGARSHDATRAFLCQADIFVLASFAEGLPVALMEAMAMQVPCVSTCVAAIPELIRDGLDGLLVPPSSSEALVVALERLIVDPELRRTLAHSGRARVVESYDLARNVGSLAAILDDHLLNPA